MVPPRRRHRRGSGDRPYCHHHRGSCRSPLLPQLQPLPPRPPPASRGGVLHGRGRRCWSRSRSGRSPCRHCRYRRCRTAAASAWRDQHRLGHCRCCHDGNRRRAAVATIMVALSVAPSPTLATAGVPLCLAALSRSRCFPRHCGRCRDGYRRRAAVATIMVPLSVLPPPKALLPPPPLL